MILKNVLAFEDSGAFVPRDLFFNQERLVHEPCGEGIDGDGCYAIPGLVDIHLHGCAGFDFCDGTTEAFCAIAHYQALHGIAAVCPATMSLPESQLHTICKHAANFHEDWDEAAFAGLHLEGPFLSPDYKGAQNSAYLHQPDVSLLQRLQTTSGGKIRLVSIAPELPGAMTCISGMHREIVFSLAHTGADYETAQQAFLCGAQHITHLYNAMPPFTHRAPGVIGAAYDTPSCRVELITDGVHVHATAVRAAFRLFGAERIILVSDSMMATGLPNGAYTLGGQSVTVRGNRACLHDGTIAGSVTNLLDCLRTAVRSMNIPLAHAVQAASANPAKAIGISKNYGTLSPGALANIILLDQNLNLKRVYLRGRRIV